MSRLAFNAWHFARENDHLPVRKASGYSTKKPITVAYTKYSTSFIKNENGEQVMFTNFTRITIKDNRGQNSGKSKWEFELERSFMQEPQFDKELRQGFLFVKADRIQNWSEHETVQDCKGMFAYYGEIYL